MKKKIVLALVLCSVIAAQGITVSAWEGMPEDVILSDFESEAGSEPVEDFDPEAGSDIEPESEPIPETESSGSEEAFLDSSAELTDEIISEPELEIITDNSEETDFFQSEFDLVEEYSGDENLQEINLLEELPVNAAETADDSEESMPDETTGEEADESGNEDALAEEPAMTGAKSGKCGSNLTWSLSNDGVLTISGTGEMDDMEFGYSPWFNDSYKIKSVIIGSEVTSIGLYAFYDFKNMTELTIGKGVRSIGGSAFYNCDGLKTITIPGRVAKIFDSAFENCSNLEKVTIPNSVNTIDMSAFSDCSSLKEITIPNNVETIGSYAFSGCVGLTGFTVPASVRELGQSVFTRCTNLKSIDVSPANRYFCTKDGVLYNTRMSVLICCPGGKAGRYVVPGSVKDFQDGAFAGCPKLTEIILPPGITGIPANLFSGCEGLKSITIPEGTVRIHSGAFSNCPGLTSITIPESMMIIDMNAFTFTDNLKDVYYRGAKEDWSTIQIDEFNAPLIKAVKHWGRKYTPPTITNVYNSQKGADIRWKKMPGAVGYNVYRFRSADGTKKVAAITNANAVQCYDPDIKDNCWGRVYHYYVKALYKKNGNTVVGPAGSKIALQRLAPMKITKAARMSSKSAHLEWACTVKDNKAYGYEIQYAESSKDLYNRSGTFKAITVNGRNNLSSKIDGLKKGKTFWFRVRCYVNYTNSISGKQTKTWSQYSNVVSLKL